MYYARVERGGSWVSHRILFTLPLLPGVKVTSQRNQSGQGLHFPEEGVKCDFVVSTLSVTEGRGRGRGSTVKQSLVSMCMCSYIPLPLLNFLLQNTITFELAEGRPRRTSLRGVLYRHIVQVTQEPKSQKSVKTI